LAEETSSVLWVRAAVERHERQLVSYAAHLLDDPERARDVVQETFCRLCSQDAAALDGHLTEWLFTVCRNHAMDVLRKERRMKPVSDSRLTNRPAAVEAPSARVEQRDESSAVLRAIGSLPPQQQEVVRLKFHHELSYKQIAAVTGMTVTHVGFVLHTAIRSLRETLVPHPAPAR
jgi:RNA polymerase sigma factor (sigma-70 family)